LDNYAPVALCRAFVARLTKAQKDVELIEYPNAYHAFDASAYRPPSVLKGAPTTRHCLLVEAEDHQIINRETQRPFSYANSCVEREPIVAYNEAASSQAHAFIWDFLVQIFRLREYLNTDLP